MKIAFIGGGNMGEAMLSAVLARELSRPENITVSDVSRERRQYIEQKYGVAVTDDIRLAAGKGEVVVLAIKPQALAEVLTGLNSCLKPAQLVLSIIAGVTVDTLSVGLSHDCIVRVMPNTPAQIGQGVSVWTATAGVPESQRERTGLILGAIGREIYVEDEKYLDMATAVSGSGPAYFFLFLEAITEAAVEIGLPRDMAQQLALETMLGSAHLVQELGKEPAELRRMVTSPGGTTAEALLVLEKGGFADILKQAVGAAYKKAKSLGDEPQ